MKLGFWMVGLPDWSNAETARQAAAHGYDGVDLRAIIGETRGAPSENVSIRLGGSSEELEAVKTAYDREGIEISSLLCYNDSPSIAGFKEWVNFEQQVMHFVEFAQRLGTSMVRVQLAAPADRSQWDRHLAEAWSAIGRALDIAPSMRAVVQNHAGRANAVQLFQTAERVGDPRIGIELSPDHMVVMQEDVLALIERYGRHIFKVCWADRRVVEEDLARYDNRYYHVRFESCWIGDGIVPTEMILNKLADQDFGGYIALKWEKSASSGTHLADGIDAFAWFPRYLRQFSSFERAH